MHHRTLTLLLTLALTTTPALAQDQDGTAQISGRVISTETGAPIDKAQVAVSLSTANPPRWTHAVLTNADGRYEIDWLPAATFLVQASADGFVSQTFSHPDDPNPATTSLVSVADAAIIPAIDFSLASAGSLHGSIVELNGDPVAQGVSVSAAQPAPNSKNFRTVSTVPTDATGHFKISRLAPGTYFVCVNGPDPATVSPSKANITYRQTCLGDTPTPDNSQTVEVHLSDPGPDLRIVVPRIAGHTLTIIPVWPSTEPTKPDHYTADAGTNYRTTPLPDLSQTLPNLPAGHYKVHISAFHGETLLGQGDSDLTMPSTDTTLHLKIAPTPAP